MVRGKNLSKDDMTPEALEKAKRQGQLNALILAAAFLLGILLPSAYKPLAPLLFVIPFAVKLMNKIRQTGENSGSSPRSQTYSQPKPDRIPSLEPYSHNPKDPKDPRRYKPIG
jgi:hypothetical protein